MATERDNNGESATLHPWVMPRPFGDLNDAFERLFPLKMYNSLTRKKERFIPTNPDRVVWYQCGPTVYAPSHLGHARTYLMLDVLRRVMRDVCGYNLILIQNVTDIDDKIIENCKKQGIPFREFAAMYENEFNEDMKAIGVELPDVVTRVSEYVPEVIEFISTLIDKGLAYESNGSVYFSVPTFRACPHHEYGKLVPEQIGNSDLLAEGEGSLSQKGLDDKKDPRDFVLWKRTPEPAEGTERDPFWDSPWGPGRPGWHIECSVMSTHATNRLTGGRLDVHAGGVDLKFPHHENEIAQSEGYLGCDQWTNYWLHTGHLNIKGFKMSKSLKNFITIREALTTHTARQMRLVFLMHKYNAPMDYGDNTMQQSLVVESKFVEFFHNVKAALRETPLSSPQKFNDKEKDLLEQLEAAKANVRAAFLDDFDTPAVLHHLQQLLRHTNKYLEAPHPVTVLLTSVAVYVTRTLKTLGLISGDSSIGFPADSQGNGVSKEEVVAPYLDALSDYRVAVRKAARKGDVGAVLRATDAIRDEVLPRLGVRLEDKGAGDDVSSIWKLDDPAVLEAERLQKEQTRKLKEEQKAEEQARKAQQEAAKAARGRIPPQEYFRTLQDESGAALYSQFDETGVPTHDHAGTELSKGAIKKLKKELEVQRKLYAQYGSN